MTASQQPSKQRAGRRWLRFSLRSLLIVVTVGSVALGVWSASAQRQRRAVAEIEAVYGNVLYDFQQTQTRSGGSAFDYNLQSEMPAWLLDIFGVDYFHAATCVVLDSPQANDATMESVSRLKRLRRLALTESNVVSNEGLAHLENMPRLQVLEIYSDTIDDRGVIHFPAAPVLEEILLQHVDISDASVKTLGNMSNLKRLWIAETRITAQGGTELEQLLPNCDVVFD